jgi:C4-dicarboxylate-specific signal transduction histidine kinase
MPTMHAVLADDDKLSTGLVHKQQFTLIDVVNEAIRINIAGLQPHCVQVVRHFHSLPTLWSERHKVLQVLIHLISNAMSSISDSGRSEGKLTLRIETRNGRARVEVEDDGVGILQEHLSSIVELAFATRKLRHGFGLRKSANGAKALGGTLSASGAGVGRGAVFGLELPLQLKDDANA